LNPAGTVTLAPTITDDGLPVGSKLSYNWTTTGFGPGITILNPTGPSTDVVISDNGANQTFQLRLTVDDSRLSSTQTFTINTIGDTPAQVFFPDNGGTPPLPTNPSPPSGSATDDGSPAGSTARMEWTRVSAPATAAFSSPNTPATTVTVPNVPGPYVFRLTA